MTSFDVFESSVESSRPIEVYTISVGVDVYYYTSHSMDITIGSTVYEAIPISRSNVGQGAEERRRNVTVRMPSDNAFVERYIDVVPGQRATVTVVRLQRDETPTFNTQVLVFKGSVASVQFIDDGNQVEVITRSIEAATSRAIPRFTFMGMCNHVWADNGCKVNSTAFAIVGNCSAETGNIITITGANAQPDGYWKGGWCKPNAKSDFRLILAHTGNNLTLLLPFSEPALSADVQVFPGCDHTLTGDCAIKFDNVLEFGGFAFVPTKNIFATGLD